jgi:hypothetical protein
MKIEIDIEYIPFCSGQYPPPIKSVKRTVKVEGLIDYQDEMDIELYKQTEDAIKMVERGEYRKYPKKERDIVINIDSLIRKAIIK